LVSEKWQQGACTGQQASLPVSPANNLQNDSTVITVAIVKSTALYLISYSCAGKNMAHPCIHAAAIDGIADLTFRIDRRGL